MVDYYLKSSFDLKAILYTAENDIIHGDCAHFTFFHPYPSPSPQKIKNDYYFILLEGLGLFKFLLKKIVINMINYSTELYSVPIVM